MMSSYHSSGTGWPISFRTLAKAVHGVEKIVRIIAGLHLGIVQIFVVRPPSLLSVTIVLLFQGIPRRLPVTDPILPGLSHVLFHDILGRMLRREEQNAEKILVRARPRRHGRRILCGCRLRLAQKNGSDALPMERQADAKFVLVFQKLGLIFAIKTYKFTIAWMLSVPYSAVIIPSDVPSYSNSDSDALCLVLDAHRCSAVNVKRYVPYSPSGRRALCVVRDAHCYSAVVVKSYLPYSR